MTDTIRSPRAALLNRLSEMQASLYYAPARDTLAQAERAIVELEEEVAVYDKLLQQRNELLREIPACEAHGDQCIPHAREWVRSAKAALAKSPEPPWWAHALNRRATVEQWMFDAANGKRPLPTVDELRQWALKLGTPEDAEIRVTAKAETEPLTRIRHRDTHEWRWNEWQENGWTLHYLPASNPQIPIRHADEFEAQLLTEAKRLVDQARGAIATAGAKEVGHG